MTTKREEMREKLLSLGKGRRYSEVTMPGGEVFCIRDLSPREALKQKMAMLDKDGKPDFSLLPDMQMKLVAMCLVDSETKEQLLSEDEWQLLDSFSDRDFECLHEACNKHCGIDEEMQVKEQVKNSD